MIDRNKVLNEIIIHDYDVTVDHRGNWQKTIEKVGVFSYGGMKASHEHYVEQRFAAINRVANQCFYSKMGEFYALKFARNELNFPNCHIDMEIRVGGEKGWVVDLPFHSKDSTLPDGHCKTCDSHTLYWVKDYSWTFQSKNKRRKLSNKYSL